MDKHKYTHTQKDITKSIASFANARDYAVFLKITLKNINTTTLFPFEGGIESINSKVNTLTVAF